MPLRVGVTGHRRYREVEQVAARIREVVDELVAESDDGTLEVWSSLAEGADRAVAEMVLARPGSTLVAVLPLPLDDYAHDCESDASVEQLVELAARATRVDVTATGGDRDEAYLRAGHAVVEASEVVVAVWDGRAARGRGGTAEIVETARRVGRRLIIVPVERDPASVAS